MSAAIFVFFAVLHAALASFGLIALMVWMLGPGGVVAFFAIVFALCFLGLSMGRDMIYRLPNLEALEHQERILGVVALALVGIIFGGVSRLVFGSDFLLVSFSFAFLIDAFLKADEVYRIILWNRALERNARKLKRRQQQ